MNDKRVDINKGNNNDKTPLWIACWNGYIEIVEYIFASGREVNVHIKDNKGQTAIDIARKRANRKKTSSETKERFQERIRRYEKIVELLESFERNPIETRFKLRLKLGLAGKIQFNFILLSFFSLSSNVSLFSR